ncbi:S-layer homology domain-containing protein [Brevibacillus laterosporus]|nr:YcdB/YcdC domain-containing protein [Brevibacillus laterosporus]TPG71103.1 S-layer homology domain-containing protein [Brevibacillus laterosporus]
MTNYSSRKWIAASCGCVLAVGVLTAPFQVFESPSVVYAAEKKVSYGTLLNQQEAEARGKQWITIPTEYKLRNSQLTKDDETTERPTWSLSWETSGKKLEKIFAMTIDAQTGELLHFFQYDPGNKATAKKVSQKEAEKTAWAFVEKVAKDKTDSLSKANEIIPSSNENSLMFTYTRLVDDIPFIENGVNVIVDATGEISSYSLTWHKGELPSSKATLSIDEAEKKLKSLLDPQLQYTELGRHTKTAKSQTTFTPVYLYETNNAQLLDASSGEAFGSHGRKVEGNMKIEPLGDKTTYDNNQKQQKISKEEAQKIAVELGTSLAKDWLLNSSGRGGASYDSTGIKTQRWSFHFTSPLHDESSSNQESEIRISINDYGQLSSYSKDDRNYRGRGSTFEVASDKKTIDKQEAEKTASAMVKKIFPNHTGQIYLKSDEERFYSNEAAPYRFTYGYLYKGIPITSNEIDVEVDKYSNEVSSINLDSGEDSFTWKNEENFEVSKISKEEAVANEIKQKKFMLTYFQAPFYVAREGISKEEVAKGIPVQLVYRYVGEIKNVNAVTGELVSPWSYIENKSASDIEGHKSEEALRAMLDRSFFTLEDGKVEPDKEVSRAEFVGWLIGLSNDLDRGFDRNDSDEPVTYSDVSATHPYYAAISQAANMKLIPATTRFEPDRAITRAEALEFLLQTLHLEALLNKSDAFQSPYPDVKTEQVPAFSIAYALGYLKTPKGTNAEPTKTVTRAEVAEMIYQVYQQNEQ